jgi:hypothetical protein
MSAGRAGVALATLALFVVILTGDVAADSPAAGLVTATGAVRGRVVGDPRRPGELPIPRRDVVIVLMPWDEGRVARLEEVRKRARRDTRAYVRSAPALDEIIRAHGASLEAQGFGALVRFARSDADGWFSLESVPLGKWLLLARPAVVATRRYPGSHRPRNQEHFQGSSRLTGHRAVDVWLAVLVVEPARVQEVELNDRSVWMTAIEEDRTWGAGR